MLAPRSEAGKRPIVGFREFVILMAALMAVNALGIDTMLPALPAMARDLGATTENQQQWIISCYLLGFGVTQLVYGPLADRYGRKPVLIAGLLLYIVTSLAASIAANFTTMIAARTLQGMASASTRVLVVSIVRDCYSGRHMARIMSLTVIVFLAAPIFAPSIGQLILLIAPWPAIFQALAIFTAILTIWFTLRMEETLHPEYRRSINPRAILLAVKTVVSNRLSIGYTLGQTMIYGAMLGFVVSSQQLFIHAFGVGAEFPLLFALIAASMAVAAFVNSRIVLHFGTRRVSHTAVIGYIMVGAVHLGSLELFGDNLVSFVMFQFIIMFFSGLIGSNYSAMAMEQMGEMAGTASSVQGTIAALGATAISMVVGQSFNGTVVPVVAGFFLCGIGSLCAALHAEGGKLFRPHHA